MNSKPHTRAPALGEIEVAAAGKRGSTVQTMRLANRSLLLNLIREHAPISRPLLARISGMHRSNVAVIAGTLIAEGLVCEALGQARGRGRVPSMLTLADRSPVVLGISVRPAETTGLLAWLDGRVERTFCFPTPHTPEELHARIAEHCLASRKKLTKEMQTVRQVVLAVPGRVFPSKGLWMPDFPQYAGFPLAEALHETLGRPVVLANGGNVAAVAALESIASDGSNSNVAFIAVHEDGVGGGIIFDGQLFSGYDGNFAGEFGHMVVESDGPQCACGTAGCWGQLISDHAVWNRIHPKTKFDGTAYRDLLRAANQGDPGSRTLLKPSITTLLRGLRNVAVTLNPQRIIVAGDVTMAWNVVEEQLRQDGLFPGFTGRIDPAPMSLSRLYEIGTTQYGLSNLFLA